VDNVPYAPHCDSKETAYSSYSCKTRLKSHRVHGGRKLKRVALANEAPAGAKGTRFIVFRQVARPRFKATAASGQLIQARGISGWRGLSWESARSSASTWARPPPSGRTTSWNGSLGPWRNSRATNIARAGRSKANSSLSASKYLFSSSWEMQDEFAPAVIVFQIVAAPGQSRRHASEQLPQPQQAHV
jgi:hypothetical protein